MVFGECSKGSLGILVGVYIGSQIWETNHCSMRLYLSLEEYLSLEDLHVRCLFSQVFSSEWKNKMASIISGLR